METSTQLLCKRDQEKKVKHLLYFCHPIQSRFKDLAKAEKNSLPTPLPVFSPFLKKICSCFSFRCNTRTLPAHVARLFGGERGMVLESA